MQITFVGTKQDFIEAQTTHAWRRYSPAYARARKIFFPLFGGALIVIGIAIGRIDHSLGIVVFETIVGLYLILARPVICPWLYRRAYRRQHSGERHESTINFTDKDIICDCPGYSHSVIEWNLIKGWIESPTQILLYTAPGRFLYVPKRLLVNDQVQELHALLSDHAVPRGAPKPSKS